jgi:serine/threonine-protein kinase PpkA
MFRSDNSLALADFGIAKRLDSDLSLTATGSIVGTLAYMSPEQASGDRADPRFDIYSAGVVFFEMLTGRRPYLERTVSAMLFQHMHGPVPDLPAPLKGYQPLLDRLMCKQIDGRFQSAIELLSFIATMRAAA